MACRECGRELGEHERFCPGCGSAVGRVCPVCKASLAADARYCGSCGEPVERSGTDSPSAVRAPYRERKIATLLFADLVDFTAIGEAHDPERVAAWVSETFERLGRQVRRYEGTIEKFAGDALLAVFGVPAIHEDDPERAVRAALEMQTMMSGAGSSDPDRPTLALRIGIETGEVLVDQARASAERDLFVTGDAVNTAARLQAAAEPGTVVVGPTTHLATRSVIEFDALPPLEVKGKAEPVAAWRAVAARKDSGTRSRAGQAAPLTGRDTEMALLERAVAHSTKHGQPYLVTIMGDAGVGKSRLAHELKQRLEGQPSAYLWRSGRCLAYADRGFGPIADVVKADAGINDDDPPRVVVGKIDARLAQVALGDDNEDVRHALELVLGVGTPRSLPREVLFEAWRSYLQAIAAIHPLVLLVEDIHWADEALLDFLDLLARWGAAPMVILCLSRHELLDVRPGWSAGLAESETIILDPLGPDATASLVQSLLGEGVPADLKRQIASLAEGNPLFAEEAVGMLADDGTLQPADGGWHLARPVEQIDMPGSVHAVLAARLDSLPADERRVAQLAAVVGRVFWDRLVAHLQGDDLDPIGERLRGLRRRDLVVPRERSTLAGAREYSFRHVLVRDVAYESLPKRDRARLHREVARWAEAALADRIDEFIELIASHLASAVAYEEEVAIGPAIGLRELREDALDAELRAARRATSLGLGEHACDWRWQAADLARALGRSIREIAAVADEDIRSHDSLSMPRHVPRLSSVIDELEGLPDLTDEDEQLLARLRSAHAQALAAAGDTASARALLERGIEQLEGGPPTPGRARLRRMLGRIYWLRGPVEEALPQLEMAIAEARASGDPETERWAIHDLGIARAVIGLDGAIELVEQSYDLARDAHDAPLINRCWNNLPSMRFERLEPLGPIIEMTRKSLEVGRRESKAASDAVPALNLSWYVREAGRLDEALAYMEEGVAAAVSQGLPLWTHLAGRATLYRLRGEIEMAERDEAELEKLGRSHDDIRNLRYQTIGRAHAVWSRDPSAALSELRGVDPVGELHDAEAAVAREIARMALRLDDRAALEAAVSIHQQRRRPGSIALEAHGRAIDGLIADDGGRTIEDAAQVLERCDYLIRALDAWSDAALLAARGGRSSVALDRALAIVRRTGLHPLLGPLPETRWLPGTLALAEG